MNLIRRSPQTTSTCRAPLCFSALRDVLQKRDIKTSPKLNSIFPHVAFFERVLVDGACAELLKKSPVVLGIFRIRKFATVHAAQFVLPISQHGAKRRVDKQQLSLEIL